MTSICFLSSAHPKFDKRVFEKEAVFLAAAGFDVTHLTPDDEVMSLTERGVRVETYQRRGGLAGRVGNLFNLYRRAKALNCDAYHANEVDSWVVAVMLKLLHRKRVVFDVHEFYPSMFGETRFPAGLQWLGSGMIRLLYRILSPFTDAIVLANRYIREDFKGISNRYELVENFGMLKTVELLEPVIGSNQRKPNDPFTLVHVGLLARERGSIAVLEALLLAKDPGLRLKLIGKIVDDDIEAYRTRVESMQLADQVDVIEWLPFEEMLDHLAKAHAGFVFFQSGTKTNAVGLPHKLFDYMAAGLPVLVSSHSRYVSDIVKDADCGWVIDSENPKEIEAVLKQLMQNPTLAAQKGANGRQALIDRYNWQSEADRLISLYKDLEKSDLA